MAPPKKVLITGASGLLGRALMRQFTATDWNVLGLAFSRVSENLVQVDLNNQKQVQEILDQFQPTFVIHAAAQRFPDKVDKEYAQSYQLNVTSTKFLAEATARRSVPLLFISTDYVFDGKNPPYHHTDAVNPVNTYGKTKAEAEEAVSQINPDSCILRVPVLYGVEEYLGESAISLLLKNLMDNSKPCKMSDYEIRYPAHTDDIARTCQELLELKLKVTNIKGKYQCCGKDAMTKYAMTKVMSDVFGYSMDHILPDPEPGIGTLRPHNTQLSTERLTALGILHQTPFRDGILSFKDLLP